MYAPNEISKCPPPTPRSSTPMGWGEIGTMYTLGTNHLFGCVKWKKKRMVRLHFVRYISWHPVRLRYCEKLSRVIDISAWRRKNHIGLKHKKHIMMNRKDRRWKIHDIPHIDSIIGSHIHWAPSIYTIEPSDREWRRWRLLVFVCKQNAGWPGTHNNVSGCLISCPI